MTESPTAADVARRALAGAIEDARPRLPGDGSDPDVPVAATVVLVRDGDDGLEVLMIERPDRGSFAGAWVFPGGKVEEGDGDGDEVDVARSAGIRETLEETGLVLDAAGLVTLSCWDPPPGLALRIRTWFFIAPAPGGPLALSPGEAVSAAWLRPQDVLARHGRGELTLYPPTWVTLHALAAEPHATAALGAARLRGVERFETVARRGAEGPLLLWEGDGEYEQDAGAPASGARHRLEIGALPWVYRRDG